MALLLNVTSGNDDRNPYEVNIVERHIMIIDLYKFSFIYRKMTILIIQDLDFRLNLRKRKKPRQKCLVKNVP